MIKKRLAFCRKHRSSTASDWTKVMFSNESTFRIINSRGARVRQPSAISRYRRRYTIASVKHSASVMVLGCFSGKVGRGGLYFLPMNTTMNGVRFKQVLADHLLPFMRIHKCKWFLQDGAPCHKSKVVMEELKKMEYEFKVMDWRSNSPDLNPIENVWGFMKRKLKDQSVTSLPHTLERPLRKSRIREISQLLYEISKCSFFYLFLFVPRYVL
jgi:transposase